LCALKGGPGPSDQLRSFFAAPLNPAQGHEANQPNRFGFAAPPRAHPAPDDQASVVNVDDDSSDDSDAENEVVFYNQVVK
jgi:hypothetical protein